MHYVTRDLRSPLSLLGGSTDWRGARSVTESFAPPSKLSDFLGRVYLTFVAGSRPADLFESEVEFEAIEPGHLGINVLGGKFVGEVLVVGAE